METKLRQRLLKCCNQHYIGLCWFTIFASLIFLCIKFVDLPLSFTIENNMTPALYRTFFWICRLGEAHFWIALILFIYFSESIYNKFKQLNLQQWLGIKYSASWFFKKYQPKVIAIYLGAVLAAGGLIVNILKPIFGRIRPEIFFETGIHKFSPFTAHGHDSFPSGHSQVIWGAMLSLWIIYPRFRPLYIITALIVSFSRILVLRHYLSDIVVSAAISAVLVVLIKEIIEARVGSFLSKQ